MVAFKKSNCCLFDKPISLTHSQSPPDFFSSNNIKLFSFYPCETYNMCLSIWHQTYSKSSKGFGLLGSCPLAHLPLDPAHEIPEWFGAGDDVERGWQSASFLKVTHPQLCPGKLPLNVCMILKPTLCTWNKLATQALLYLFYTLVCFNVWSLLTAMCW